MGLKDKIKGALHNDKGDETYGSTYDSTGSHTTHGTSGTHTTGDYTGHSDPKYGSTNTTGLGRDHTTGTTGTSYDNTSGLGRDHHTTGTSYDNSGITGDRHSNPVTGSGVGHRQTDSGVGLDSSKHGNTRYDAAGNRQDPYWGAMGQGQTGRNSPPGTTSHTLTGETERDRLQRKDLPLRPNEQHQQSGITSDIGGGRHGDLSRDPVGPSGGTYNSVAGAGSRDFESRGNNHTLNAVGYQNQPSGIRGQADDGYDSRLRDRDLGRDPKSGLSGSGVGAGAGLTGAGLASSRGNDFNERANADSRDMGLNPSSQYQTGGGVPQSSMLDPYQTGPNAGRTGAGADFTGDRTTDSRTFGQDRGVGGPGAFNNSSTTGAYGTTTGLVHDSHMANKVDPRVDSDRDGSHTLGGRQGGIGHDERSGLGSGGITSGLGANGMGPGHFGPGHDGAKVMHKCAGCGLDNDISQYFRKDAVYRMS